MLLLGGSGCLFALGLRRLHPLSSPEVLTHPEDRPSRGLAIALIFGLLISTLLTLVVIPVLYYALMRKRVGQKPVQG